MNATRVEAQKYVSLCYQIMLSIGCDGDIIPNNRCWSQQHIKSGNIAKNFNVTEVVLNALTTSVEAAMCMKCKDPTVKDVVHLQFLLRSSVLHALRLYALKQGLLNEPVKHYAGLKFHGIFYHVGIEILLFGAPSFYDTARFEHAHIADGVMAFLLTSKRKLTQTEEMLLVSLRRKRQFMLSSLLLEDVEEIVEVQPEGTIMAAGGIKRGAIIIWNYESHIFQSEIDPFLCHPLLDNFRMNIAINGYIETLREDRESRALYKLYRDFKKSSYSGSKIVFKCENSLKLTHESDQGIPPYTLVACKEYVKGANRNRHRYLHLSVITCHYVITIY